MLSWAGLTKTRSLIFNYDIALKNVSVYGAFFSRKEFHIYTILKFHQYDNLTPSVSWTHVTCTLG